MTTITRDHEKEDQVGGEFTIYNLTDIHEDIVSLEYAAVFGGGMTPTIKRKDNDPHVYLTAALIQAINALAMTHDVIPTPKTETLDMVETALLSKMRKKAQMTLAYLRGNRVDI